MLFILVKTTKMYIYIGLLEENYFINALFSVQWTWNKIIKTFINNSFFTNYWSKVWIVIYSIKSYICNNDDQNNPWIVNNDDDWPKIVSKRLMVTIDK
jgi:hypothetical protein